MTQAKILKALERQRRAWKTRRSEPPVEDIVTRLSDLGYHVTYQAEAWDHFQWLDIWWEQQKEKTLPGSYALHFDISGGKERSRLRTAKLQGFAEAAYRARDPSLCMGDTRWGDWQYRGTQAKEAAQALEKQ